MGLVAVGAVTTYAMKTDEPGANGEQMIAYHEPTHIETSNSTNQDSTQAIIITDQSIEAAGEEAPTPAPTPTPTTSKPAKSTMAAKPKTAATATLQQQQQKKTTTTTTTITTPEPVTTTPAPAPTVTTTCTGGYATEFLCLLNQYRVSQGKGKLSYDSALSSVALAHSSWMLATGTFSHTSEDGSTLDTRCATANVSCRAENLAMGAGSAENLLRMWKNSLGHNTNLLGPYTTIGLGIASSYTTAVFY